MYWNYGDLFDGCGDVLDPLSVALIHGERTVNWGDLTARSNNLARAMLEGGAVAGDKVAIYLRNCPEYMETLVACFKARLVPVNVNYRYQDDELFYILENSDARFVIHSVEFADHVSNLQRRLPTVQWLDLAGRYEQAVSRGDGSPLSIKRSGEDMLFVYTGGTTGAPKAVMWRQQDIWHALRSGRASPCNRGKAVASPVEHLENLRQFGSARRQLTACPLMHGTGLMTSMSSLCGGAAIVTLTGHGFDPEELWDAVETHKVNGMVIVGDAFARPMLQALEDNPGRWDISSLKNVVSSGVMWSPATKRGLLEYNAELTLMDAFGSSEALGFGSSITTADNVTATAKFVVGEHCKVFTEDFDEVQPGSGQRGFIARPGPIPMGYYKDEEKSSKTFPTINGVRYSIPGDWCTVEADGSLTLLGRGSACINSAGEKIYPEEVEEMLKTHPDVEDALVFGMEDEKWGQAVTAVLTLRTGAILDAEAIRAYVRSRLAHYKVPKSVWASIDAFRSPSGKADYLSAKAFVDSL
ncbi:MAG: acyl-CoA synthetase [Halioglobus sp.]